MAKKKCGGGPPKPGQKKTVPVKGHKRSAPDNVCGGNGKKTVAVKSHKRSK